MAGEHVKKKWPLWVKLLLGVSPLFILLAAGLIWDGIAFGRLNSVMEEVEAAGFKTSIADLEAERRVWPDEENGALVIMAIGDKLNALWENREDFGQLVVRPADQEQVPLGCRWDKQTRAGVERFLSEHQDLIEQIGQLAKYQGGRFPLDTSGPASEIRLPSLSPLRNSAKLTALQAEHDLLDGKTERFVAGIDVLRRHSMLLADEPFVFSHLVALACERLTLSTLERGLGLAELPAEDLKELDGVLAGMAPREPLKRSFMGELAFFMDCCERYRRGELSQFLNDPDVPTWLRGVPGARGILTADQAFGVEHYRALIEASTDPAEGLSVAKSLAPRIATIPGYFILSRSLLPSFSRFLELQLRTEGKAACTRIALAAERYRLDHGRFPARLDDLVPEYLDALPVDPVDEKPMRYLTDEDGAVVYSVGQDGVDDGGMMEQRVEEGESPDVGFVLLKPELRGRSAPETQPGE